MVGASIKLVGPVEPKVSGITEMSVSAGPIITGACRFRNFPRLCLFVKIMECLWLVPHDAQ